METWLGQIQIKVDEKGRLALPAAAVTLFEEREMVLSVGVFDKKPYLDVLPLDVWEEKLESLKKLPSKSPKTKAYRRFLLSCSSKVSLDKQNRITIPIFQREMIKLLKKLVLINLENKIELWSAAVWEEVSDSYLQNFESLEDWAFESDEAHEEQGGEHGLKSVA